MNIKEFGSTEDGRTVYLYTLTNKNVVEVSITNYGGIITSIAVPDREGKAENIVLGVDTFEEYFRGTYYFGAIIGRYSNRIKDARFSIDDELFELQANDGNNHLHGGVTGFDKVVWAVDPQTENSVTLSYLSKDGEEGYPGNLNVQVTYSLNDKNELMITYKASTDQATPVNLTNHSYFNLSGDPEDLILDHELMIDADHYTPVNDELIPTGVISTVDDTPFDFREAQTIGSRINLVEGGYDHNWILNRYSGEVRLVATLYHADSGREMEVLTSEPGIQFYSGNFLDETLTGSKGEQFIKHSGLCLETQHFPDSPNHPAFPSTLLMPGETYESTTIYRFSSR